VSADAVIIRPALRSDLPGIVHLYSRDELHGASEPGRADVAEGYLAAFDAMSGDADNAVYVADLRGSVLGTCQLTFIRQLSYGGCLVAQVESVYVDAAHRSQGVGQRLLKHVIELARERGALRIQLTTNLKRARAHRFYERLGFRATHHGMKLYFDA
jgi:GNAT superfamily N-acetyltransferase